MLPACLRLKQQLSDKKAWLVKPDTGKRHHGTHFPLFMVTKNSSARSDEALRRRREKHPLATQSWTKQFRCQTAVAAEESWWTSAWPEHEQSRPPLHVRPSRNDQERAESWVDLQQRAQITGRAFDGLEVDNGGGAGSWSNGGGAKRWGRSDWDWSGSHWDWSDYQSWWG